MACSCTYYDVIISSADLLDATGNSSYPDNTVYVAYIDCNGNSFDKSFTGATTYPNDICVTGSSSPFAYYYKNDIKISGVSVNSQVNNTLTDCCPTPTPTPTPTQTETPTPSPTPSITPTITLTPTNISCGQILTTGPYIYRNCCGTLVSGTDAGLTIPGVDYNYPGSGYVKLFIPSSVICPSPSITPTQTPTPSLTSNLTPTPTPTISLTPSITPSPTQTPGVSPVFRLANNCETFTSFPLGVSCQTITQPTGANGLDGSLRIRISGGTPPYSIFWSNGSKSQILSGLNPGSYEAIVTDFYGDYTATTICSLFAITPSPTTTITPTITPTPSPVYSSLCLLLLSNTTTFTPLQFVFSGIINSKPSWISGTYIMAWSNTNNRWEIQGFTVFGGLLVSTTTLAPPLSNWTLVGGTQTVTANVVTGTCPAYTPFNATFTKSDSDCTNNGSIVISSSGGVPPYLYSNNGGLSFQPSNIFNNLSPQTYSVVAKDSVNNQATSSITILLVGSTQTYTLSLVNTQTQNLSSGIRRVYWQVNVSPALPAGTSIPFVLNIESVQDVNGPGTGTISSTSLVYNLGTPVVATTTNSSSISAVRPDCSPETTTTTTVVQTYNLTLTSSGGISGLTTSNLNVTNPQIGLNGCITTLVQNVNIFITQATTAGCSCCVANYDSASSAGIVGHQLSAEQGGGSQLYFPSIVGLSNSPAGACSDLALSITRLINSSVFGPGVGVFTGNPNNPQLATGFNTVAGPDGTLYTLTNGIVGSPIGAC